MSGFKLPPTALESLFLGLCLLMSVGEILSQNGVMVVVKEGSDAVLPCLISTKEDIVAKFFGWMKDGQKVFIYRSGFHSNDGLPYQDLQFKGRVSHFQDQLKNGNASIKIHNTKMTDSGNYRCIFQSQTFIIELVVGVKVVVKEGSDAVLPCLISTEEDIVAKIFGWMKDGQKEVFIYRSGFHSNNSLPYQDKQFRGRVSHFQDQLKNGNASIKIHKTKMADSGNYRCIFQLQSFYIELVVERLLKDRSGEIPGASKPVITTPTDIKHQLLLQCEVRGASPKPKVEWQDSSGNILPAEKPQVSERGGRYYVTLKTNVTKTGRYRCVVTQEEISHQTYSETVVFISDKLCESCLTREILGLLAGYTLGTLICMTILVCKLLPSVSQWPEIKSYCGNSIHVIIQRRH